MKIFIIIYLFCSINFSFALEIDELANMRAESSSKKITVTGIISKMKDKNSKDKEYLEFTVKSKFSSNYLVVRYYISKYGKQINPVPSCHVGQSVIVQGVYFAKNKNKNLGSIEIDKFVPIVCKDDSDYTKLDQSFSLKELSELTKSNEYNYLKIKGYINKLRFNSTDKHSKVSFYLIDHSKKIKLKVNILLSANGYTVNKFDCGLGSFVTLTGAFDSKKSSKKMLGELNILSREFIKCSDDKIVVGKSEKKKLEKNIHSEEYKKLKSNFRLLKRVTTYSNKKSPRDQVNLLINKMADTCKKYKTKDFGDLCAEASYYVRAIEQRNQISFKIISAMKHMSGWQDLKPYRLKVKNSVLEVIKALYPTDSDYIIGIPDRCYSDQQFNPSASNFPYRELKVSKYAKQNFTAILNEFNNPALKCENLMGSIFFIGNMDEDPTLEVIKINLQNYSLIEILKSDF